METKPRLAIYYHDKFIINQHSDNPMICHKLFETKPLVNIVCQTLINMPLQATSLGDMHATPSLIIMSLQATCLGGMHATPTFTLHKRQASTIKTCVWQRLLVVHIQHQRNNDMIILLHGELGKKLDRNLTTS